ncbi:MAG TPA: AI-2E family transporter [Bryobacteraceae bacterium]|nr:AI-2E family transporter [Bryobacteraceae bacterium]
MPIDGKTVKQILGVAVLLGLIALLAIFVISVFRVFLLIFAATLIAVFLHGCAAWLSRHIRIPVALAVALVILGIFVLIGGASWILAPQVTQQFQQLQISIPQEIAKLEQQVGGRGSALFGRFAQDLIGNVTGVTKAEHWVIDILVVAFLSVYLAFQPSMYRRGLLALIPVEGRGTTQATMDRLRDVLWRWFIGRLVGMIVIGLLVFIAMSAIGIPLPFMLGLMAGILEFVPYLGAFVSAIPAVLFALVQGQGLIVIAMYLLLHGIDGYIVIPLVERRAVSIAPGLTVVAQVTMYISAGILGIFVADPLTAAIMIVLQIFYIREPVKEE